jgi:hypothetical protein
MALNKRTIDLTGKRFGRLTVITDNGKSSKGIRWLCQCDCGNKKTICGSSLRGGVTKSCGCYNVDSHTKHGHDGSRTYKTWSSMKERCNNKNHKAYHRYGGRGIKVCDEWNEFVVFLKDMGERPEGRTLDRIKNDRGYCKDNCKWATPKEQSLNRCSSNVIEYNGETNILKEWARILGINYATLFGRINSGWTVDDAFNTPVLRRAKK